MRTITVIVAATLAASCSAQSDICTPVPDLVVDIGPEALGEIARRDPNWLERRAANCIHRWGYRLAPSQDEGLTVAKAVMQACEGAVKEQAEARATAAMDTVGAVADPAVGRMAVFEETQRETLAQLEREALFRVQTARAGKCKA